MDFGRAFEVALGLFLMYLLLSLAVTAAVEYIATLGNFRLRYLHATLRKLMRPTMQILFESSGQVTSIKEASRVTPFYLDSTIFSKALVEVTELRDDTGSVAADAFQKIKALPECSVKAVMLDEWRRVAANVKDFENAMAGWFESAVERGSTAYKQPLAIFFGIWIAACINADTFAVALSIWVKAETLPIGWGYRSYPQDLLGWSIKLIGIGITGVALAAGAPFWFDVLSKIARLRSGGGKSEDTAEKAKTAKNPASSA